MATSGVFGQVISGNAGHISNQVPGSDVGFEDDADIDAISYHTHNLTEIDNSCAKGATFGKPIIISDDNSSAQNVTNVLSYISRAASKGEHYEHYDYHLGEVGGDGTPIDDENDFPANSLTILTALGDEASTLSAGGTLTVSGREFKWNGTTVSLFGSSWFGALVGLNFNITGYLDTLSDYGVNLTRQWCIEQWTATCNGGCTDNGVVQYSGSYQDWDISHYNQAYFDRLRTFVKAASDRGIVVQLTLFDRHGMLDVASSVGRWEDSPYNTANNSNGLLSLISGKNYPAFIDLDPATIWDINDAFIYRTLYELRDYGNVMYEIMNEPLGSWTDSTVSSWHSDVADAIISDATAVSGDDVGIDFGEYDRESGVSRHMPEATNSQTVETTIGSRECRRNKDSDDRHFFMLVDDNWAYQGDKTSVDVTIEYYDTGTDGIKLIYDSTGGNKNAGTVNMTNTNTWKSYTWNLTDAYFGNRSGAGYDFRLTNKTSGVTFHIDTVEISEGSQPPTASISANPTSGAAPLAVSFDGSGSTDNGSIVSYEWDFENDGTFDATGVSTSHTYTSDATYTCKLRVTDNDSLTDDDTVTISVNSGYTYTVDVDFGNTDVENGLGRKVPEDGNANTEGTTIGGRNCRKNVNSGDRHFFMLVDDSWAYQGNRTTVDVTIEYYDTGTDGINLVYDGTAGNEFAGRVNFGNTNTWKSYTWNITDAYFGNRSGTGYDFRLTAKTSGSIFYVDTVELGSNQPLPGVEVDFGTTDVEDGLERKEPEAGNANTEGATIGGRNCRKNVNSGDRHFYMLVDDSWAYQGNKTTVDVTIEYYDTGSDGLNLVYDSTSGDSLAGTINFGNTNTWKSYVFNLTDAYFGNRSGTGYDFRLTAKTAGSIFYVDKVEIVE
jgi:PKD repeat protein